MAIQINPIKTYEMTVHAFGLTSSFSVAGYALRRTTEDNRKRFSEAAYHTVRQNFYVDDLLKSVDTLEAALHLIDELDVMLQNGAFASRSFRVIIGIF